MRLRVIVMLAGSLPSGASLAGARGRWRRIGRQRDTQRDRAGQTPGTRFLQARGIRQRGSRQCETLVSSEYVEIVRAVHPRAGPSIPQIRIGRWPPIRILFAEWQKISGMAILALAGSSTFEGGIMKSASGTAIVVAVMIATIPLIHPNALARGIPATRPARLPRVGLLVAARAPRRLAPADIPRKIFEEFRKKAPGISASSKASRNSATVTAYPSHWECGDGQTLLTLDVRGNASYRKTAGWSPNPPGNNADPGRPASSGLDEAKLIEKTRQLAKPWISADFERSLHPGREAGDCAPGASSPTVKSPRCQAGPSCASVGRTNWIRGISRRCSTRREPRSAWISLSLKLEPPTTATWRCLARIPAHGQAKNDKPLALGCFFDPDEYRFEITALSVEGERFLDLYQAANPFGRDDYDLHRPHQVSARHYSESGDYHWWCWTWWQRYGRVGGFRGNWLKKGSKAGWQYAHNHLLHHRSLASYGLVEGSPRQTKVIERPNEPPVEFPHAVDRHLEPAFYRDLEQCHVAFMFSHGGRLRDFYQMQARSGCLGGADARVGEAGHWKSTAFVPVRMRGVQLSQRSSDGTSREDMDSQSTRRRPAHGLWRRWRGRDVGPRRLAILRILQQRRVDFGLLGSFASRRGL